MGRFVRSFGSPSAANLMLLAIALMPIFSVVLCVWGRRRGALQPSSPNAQRRSHVCKKSGKQRTASSARAHVPTHSEDELTRLAAVDTDSP
eukprot:4686135-Prymnesium_polylepis.1